MLGEVAKKYRKGLLQTITFLQQLHDESIVQEQADCLHQFSSLYEDKLLQSQSYWSCNSCGKHATLQEFKDNVNWLR